MKKILFILMLLNFFKIYNSEANTSHEFHECDEEWYCYIFPSDEIFPQSEFIKFEITSNNCIIFDINIVKESNSTHYKCNLKKCCIHKSHADKVIVKVKNKSGNIFKFELTEVGKYKLEIPLADKK